MPTPVHLPADDVIVAWLDEKTGKSRSWKTHIAYHNTALSLRAMLQQHGYGLFADLADDTRYAGYLLVGRRTRPDLTPHGPPQRLHLYGVISSLFDYAKRIRLYRGDNPIDAISRRKHGDRQGARALDMLEMRKRMSRIERHIVNWMKPRPILR